MSPIAYSLQPSAQNGKLFFVDAFRVLIMVLVCFCILAVDFRVFPRFQAKTESVGVSLMDLGVGCMMFSAGLVAKVPSQHSQYLHSEHALTTAITVS